MPIDNSGSSILPTFAIISDRSLGFYQSAASAMGLSYGQLQLPDGTAPRPAQAYSSESSLGWYRSATSQVGLSYGTLNVPGISISGGGDAIITTGAGQYETGLTVTASQHATSRRAGITLDTWTIGSDANGDGVKNFFFYGGAVAGKQFDVNPAGIGTFYAGLVLSAGTFTVPTGTALAPSIAYGSEISLGLYRSGASTVALSYGTMDLTANGAMTSIASLKIKSGANNSCGTAVLGSNGSVNVANTYVKTGDLIFLTDQTAGGTLGDLELGGIRNSSGFTILSTSLTDTSTVAWLIIRPG